MKFFFFFLVLWFLNYLFQFFEFARVLSSVLNQQPTA